MNRVLIGMSGGVDSATAALLLQRAGYEVEGATLLLHGVTQEGAGLCGSSAELASAQASAAALGIPHHALDYCSLFRSAVMDRFVAEYRAGRTPNPCLDCNRDVKFGRMLDWALEQGFDYIATGHYARVRYDEGRDRWLLLRGRDEKKDQSYVLYQMTQKQLSHLLLPLGEYEKTAVRAMAADSGLPSAQKPDSQDICFVPDGDYVRFLQEYGDVTLEPGNFVDKNGRILGQHRGLEAYTTGQRKGLGVSGGKRLYVISKDSRAGTVLLGDDADLYASALTAERVNWLSLCEPSAPIRVTAKTRYSQTEADATVIPLPGGRIRVEFDTPQRAITAGQAVVFYQGEEVTGGGVIEGTA